MRSLAGVPLEGSGKDVPFICLAGAFAGWPVVDQEVVYVDEFYHPGQTLARNEDAFGFLSPAARLPFPRPAGTPAGGRQPDGPAARVG